MRPLTQHAEALAEVRSAGAKPRPPVTSQRHRARARSGRLALPHQPDARAGGPVTYGELNKTRAHDLDGTGDSISVPRHVPVDSARMARCSGRSVQASPQRLQAEGAATRSAGLLDRVIVTALAHHPRQGACYTAVIADRRSATGAGPFRGAVHAWRRPRRRQSHTVAFTSVLTSERVRESFIGPLVRPVGARRRWSLDSAGVRSTMTTVTTTR